MTTPGTPRPCFIEACTRPAGEELVATRVGRVWAYGAHCAAIAAATHYLRDGGVRPLHFHSDFFKTGEWLRVERNFRDPVNNYGGGRPVDWSKVNGGFRVSVAGQQPAELRDEMVGRMNESVWQYSRRVRAEVDARGRAALAEAARLLCGVRIDTARNRWPSFTVTEEVPQGEVWLFDTDEDEPRQRFTIAGFLEAADNLSAGLRPS